jgi:hypothetical protein
MTQQAKLLDLTDYARSVEVEFIDDLPATERDASGTAESWTAKDTVAHVAAWRTRGSERLVADSRGESLKEESEFDEANRLLYEKNRALSWDEVSKRSREAWSEFLKSLRETTEAVLSAPSGSAGSRPVWRRVTVDGGTHPVFHYSEYAIRHGRGPRALSWMEGLSARLIDLDPAPEWQGVVHYNMACHFALSGQSEPALESLRKSLQLNPGLREWANQDSDLTSLHGDPQFAELAESPQ